MRWQEEWPLYFGAIMLALLVVGGFYLAWASTTWNGRQAEKCSAVGGAWMQNGCYKSIPME